MHLDQMVQKRFEKVPPIKKKWIITHNAISYLARRYGIQVYSFQGISTVTEPSTYQRILLRDFIIEQNIFVIYYEYSCNSKAIFALQQDCKKKNHQVICCPIYSDTIAPMGSPHGGYIASMIYNIDQLAKAFEK